MKLQGAIFIITILANHLLVQLLNAQTLANHQYPGMGNPIIPGYFADPTIKKIGDTFYLYATTDGNGGGFGPSQVWTSKDFVNWTIQPMNWPTTHWYWAPDMTKGYDGRYYLYYCQPVELYGAVSDSPTGPWTSLLPNGQAMVPNYFIPGVITLDGQTFTDDDGKIYLFWGTWGIYPDHGSGVALLDKDMKTLKDAKLIANTMAKDFFEAPFMFKRNGVYYFMYSSGRCEDDTYRVQYVKSNTGPMGPFQYPDENPILATNADGSVHGPGHHSILQEGDDYYIIYHRHNNPHSGGGFHRQIAADKLEFDEQGNIKKIVPTHEGIGFLGKSTLPYTDLAYSKKVTASSYYSEDFSPQFTTDNNNGTLWKSADNMSPAWLQIDLGSTCPVRTIHTQFEYPMWYYEYVIEYSTDGKNWKIFADKRNNRQSGSPIIDGSDVQARYIRTHIYNTQVPGMFKAIWNIKVFSEANAGGSPKLIENKETTKAGPQQGLLVDMSIADAVLGDEIKNIPNNGKLTGEWIAEGNLYTAMIAGKKAIVFSGKETLTSSFSVPSTLAGNSSYTVAMWVYNPDIDKVEPIVSWTSARDEFTRGVIGYGNDRGLGAVNHGGWTDMGYRSVPVAGQWHHIAITFDGYIERIFVDGKEDRSANKMIFMKEDNKFTIGSTSFRDAYFDGALAGLKIYDKALSPAAIHELMKTEPQSSVEVYLLAGMLKYGPVKQWVNEGVREGQFILSEGTAQVTDVGGKIAVQMGKEAATFRSDALKKAALSNTDYSISLSLYITGKQSRLIKNRILSQLLNNQRWHQLVWTRQSGNESFYVDGVLTNVSTQIPVSGIVNLAAGTLTIEQTAFYSMEIEARSMNLEEVSQNYQLWLSHTNTALNSTVPEFSSRPHMISDRLVYMKAKQTDPNTNSIAFSFTDVVSGITSGWLKKPEYLFDLPAENRDYEFVLKIKDGYGNVSLPSVLYTINTASETPSQWTDDFQQTKIFTPSDSLYAFWSGFIGGTSRGNDSIKVQAQANNGILTLSSADSRWDGSESRGPFIYKEVAGDFLVEVEINEVSGMVERRGSPNESGMMVRVINGEGRRGEQLLQSSIMTGWNIGNLVTTITNGRRMQQNNGSGWNFDAHLQIQRDGNNFYLRSSKDGKTWIDLPGSPFLREDMAESPVQVGLFQASNDKTPGFGRFKDFQLFIKDVQ